jgi:hypothetical protein
LICTKLKHLKLGCNTGAKIFTQACIHLKQTTHQKSQEKELACKSYAQDTLLLKVKINQKVFSSKPDSINKIVELDFWIRTKLIWQFLDFSTNFYGFSKLADLN